MLNGIRRIRSVVSLVVIAQFILTLSGCGTTSSTSSTPSTPATTAALSAKNVILIIGDGMQLEHERAANNYLFGTPESGLEHQALPYKGAASTWDVNTYNRYAFSKYSSNGFSSKKYSDSAIDLNTVATFDSTLGYDPAKGGKLPYRQDITGQTAYFSTKYKDSATGSAATAATDSASAATALAAGFKTDSGSIAWRTASGLSAQPDNGRLTTIAEMYRYQKKASIGVVSTVPFSHATPAGFVSHNKSRNNYKAIAQEIITGVRPDVVIGGGHPAYNSATSSADYTYIDAPEYSYLKNSSTTSDYNFVQRKAGVDGGTALLAAADTAVANKQKLFGLFGGAGGNFDYHKVSNDGTATITRGSIENPTLADASKAALKVLSQNSNGFFLMLEQGDIDWSNHSNDYASMVGGIWDLNNAVKAVEAYIDNKTNNVTWDNTLVIVTSDHGNSFMRLKKDLPKGKLPVQTPNGAGAPAGYATVASGVSYYYDPTEVTYGFNGLGMNDHTNELVTLYAKGAGSSLLSGYEGLWYPGTRIVDNTHIYKTMMAALGLTDENRAKVTGSQPTTFLYTSDAHYGIKRSVVFGSYSNAVQVNSLMIRSMNNMPNELLPSDFGIKAGQQVGPIDFIAMTGDIANRMQAPVQTATASWGQFKNDYINNVTILAKDGKKAGLYLTPGNHDVSNAIGYTKTMSPATDDAVMFNLYNMFMSPAVPLVAGGYNYASQRIVYSKDIGGVHFVFLSMWPDKTIRPLIDADLAAMSNKNMPVVLFTHDQPDIETKHLSSDLTNYVVTPVTLDWTKKFENLVTDVVADNDTTGVLSTNSPSTTAQKGLADWLATKKNIVAYFHGNDNYSQNYTWPGTSNQLNLNVFRVDSPMKGVISGIDAADGKGDPTKLAYNVVTIDAAAQYMTVREYLWQQKKWGASPITVSLAVRSK